MVITGGNLVTFTARLLIPPLGDARGTVTFQQGGYAVSGAMPVNADGVATITMSVWPSNVVKDKFVYDLTYTAAYSGVPGVYAPSSASLDLQVSLSQGQIIYELSLIDDVTGVAVGELTFNNVTSSGVTTISSLPPPDPSTAMGSQLGSPAAYVDISTYSKYTGTIQVKLGPSLVLPNLSPPALYHYENGIWKDVTVSTSPLTGVVSSLSPFAIAPKAVIVPIDVVNTINLASNGETQVRIHAAAGFNPLTDIDRTKVQFGRTGFEQSLIQCEPNAKDLLCHFRTSLLGFASNDTSGMLRGKTVTKLAIEGSAPVKVTGAAKP